MLPHKFLLKQDFVVRHNSGSVNQEVINYREENRFI